MTPPSARAAAYVVDASVAIKLFVEESLSGAVERLFERLATSPNMRLFVPDLFYTECANILWKYVTRHNMNPAMATGSLTNLRSLALEKLDTDLILADALDLALQHGVTVYDACYLASARLTHAPLITADDRLIRKFEGDKQLIIPLRELALG